MRMNTLQWAKEMDQQDPLNKYREEFYIDNNKIYFDGNSLGLLSKRAESALYSVMEAWRTYGIDGWTEGKQPWFYLAESLGNRMRSLVGADEGEVVVSGSTTVNMHQLVSTFYQPREGKTKILADHLNFPSDIYALKSQIALKNLDDKEHLIQVESRDGYTLHDEDIVNEMTEDVALIVLPSVLYRSGQVLNMERLTTEAHKRGILIGFDLSHSIGAIPHELSKWDVDFAFWCNYKHLNGGPGSTGGYYVNKRHFAKVPGLAGWFSSDKSKQFDMKHELEPASDAGAYQIGTPNLLSMAPIIGSLAMFEEVGMGAIREKSLKLTGYLMSLIETELGDDHFTICNPREDDSRGGHILLQHNEAARICKALKEAGVIPDFRSPSVIRLAPVALYNTFTEVYHCVEILKDIMKNETYKKFENKRGVVA
nr:kynureninase [Bacillus coahuilensis]